LRQHLEVETPEHVVLDLEIAGVGSRLLAAVIDSAIVTTIMVAGGLLAAVLAGLGLIPRHGGAWLAAVAVGLAFALGNGYFILFEGLRGGQTPGKRTVGIRVVRDTGHPVTLGAAALRNLLRVADFLPPPYLLGLGLIAFHPRAKRLGDLVAGTVVVRDRPSPLAASLAGQGRVAPQPGGSPDGVPLD